MRTSYDWIKDLVPGLTATPQEYMDAMTLSGSKVEFYTEFDKDLDKIVVGEIKELVPHPDSDHLVICQVDIGTETIQIVTGAPNTAVGQKVPVVLDGGRVAGGHDGSKTEGGIKIKKGKLRGVESNGMMCSIEELGASRDQYPEAPENGLYIFPEESGVKPGDDAIEALGLHDTAIEYEITSNRVDCFAILGIAREAAATFRLEPKFPEVPETGDDDDVNNYLSASIEAEDLCSRYTARVVKDVKIAPSPAWMQKRLRSQGIRPINNLVDITNYVMLEYGQPMHAYDLDTIADHKIVVKRAADGDVFTTLDGQERNVDHDTLMIYDGQKAIGLAGIMGGENSMITDDVKTMALEAACFDGTNIRLSSKRVGIRTDASGIFEKGLDPNNAIEAMNRACALVEELGAGTVVGGAIDVYPKKKEEIRIPFQPKEYNEFLGTDVSEEEQREYFRRLELKIDDATGEVIIPTFRQDLVSFADLAEEVARFYGYDKIPTTLPKGTSTAGKLSYKLRIEQKVREVIQFAGFSQAMSYSFESPKVFDKLMLPEDAPERNAIRIANPLGEDFSIMRTISLNGILTSLATNFNRRNKNVRLYEMGNIYLPKALPLTELPDERMTLTLGFYGDGNFYTMKGVLEEILTTLGMNEKVRYDAAAGRPYLHPGRQANAIYNGNVIGYIGEVHPLVGQAYNLSDRVYVAVLDLPQVVEQASFDRKYTGIANFPASTRDLSLVAKKALPVGDIEDVFDAQGGEYLESYELFDVYEGERIAIGHKSIAYSLTFRAKDRNLADTDVNEAMDRILAALKEIGVEIRS